MSRFGIWGAAAALFIGGTSLGPEPIRAQSADLEALEEQLPGKLVNDPSRLDWESYGDIERSASVDQAIPGGGAAIRFEVKSASEFIYTAGTNIPLTRSVSRGKDVTVGFYARTIEADTGDGQGVLRVRFQQNAEPYPGFGEETLSIGPEWDWYEVTAKAEQKLRSKDGIVALQFGRTRQTIEIGQAIVVEGATAIAGETPMAMPQPDIEPLVPDTLAGAGALLNNPMSRDWQHGGDGGSYSEREEPQVWLGRATRFSSESANSAPDLLFTRIPVQRAIAEGDELLIAIAARAESAKTDDGRAIVGVMVQDNSQQQDSFARNRFTLGPNWQLIRLRTKSPRAYPAGTAEVSLLFSWAEQEVDIGPVYVLKTN